MTFGNRKFAGFLGAATVVIIAEYVLVLSDCVISGRVLGETALGSMNLLMPVFSTVSFFTWMLAVGTSIVYSDAVGRTDREFASKLAGQGLAAAITIGTGLAVIVAFMEGPYLSFMASDAVTVKFVRQYWTWYPLVVLLEAIDMLLLYLVYTDGGRIACLCSYVGQVTVNISAAYFLCAKTRLGMCGISLGTLLAYVVGIAALLPHLRSSKCQLRFRPAFMPRELIRSFKLSFGDASAGLFHALLFFLITKYLLYRWGSETLPIAAVVFCIVRLTVFFNGVGIALQPLETVYHGEGNETGVLKLVRFATVVSAVEGLAISAVILAVPDLIVSLVGIGEPGLGDASRHAVRLAVSGFVGYAMVYMLNSHYQYIGKPGRSVSLTASAFLIVPAILVLVFGGCLGLSGVWLAVSVGPLCALVTVVPFWRRSTAGLRLPNMWTVKLWKTGGVEAVLESARRFLDDENVGEPLARTVTETIGLALRQVRDGNRNRKVIAELTLDCRNGVRVIVRDDGVNLPFNGSAGVGVVHMPAAGFNRNVLTWSNI